MISSKLVLSKNFCDTNRYVCLFFSSYSNFIEYFPHCFHLVCDNLDNYSTASPFLCMDLSYITALLKEGFGFGDSTVLQASKNCRIQLSISSHEVMGNLFILVTLIVI